MAAVRAGEAVRRAGEAVRRAGEAVRRAHACTGVLGVVLALGLVACSPSPDRGQQASVFTSMPTAAQAAAQLKTSIRKANSGQFLLRTVTALTSTPAPADTGGEAVNFRSEETLRGGYDLKARQWQANERVSMTQPAGVPTVPGMAALFADAETRYRVIGSKVYTQNSFWEQDPALSGRWLLLGSPGIPSAATTAYEVTADQPLVVTAVLGLVPQGVTPAPTGTGSNGGTGSARPVYVTLSGQIPAAVALSFCAQDRLRMLGVSVEGVKGTAEFDFEIGRDGLPVRMTLSCATIRTTTREVQDDVQEFGPITTVEVTYSGFGRPVTVTAPARSQLVTRADLDSQPFPGAPTP